MHATAAILDPSRVVRYRRLHRLGWLVGIFLLLVAVLGVSRRTWSRDERLFDQKRYTVERVINGDTIELADNEHTRVGLLGIDAPDEPAQTGGAAAGEYLQKVLAGKIVLVKLDGPRSRDEAGRLTAYLYLADTIQINQQMIDAGLAYSDRRVKHSFRSAFDQAESAARKKHRGLWADVTDATRPAWRLQWLRSLDR